ncbi:MAG: hypothetical protein IT518_04325 [Burkholderiales bacterium]|nr:hypothetical protein [Burkholderiales bacterium]
MKPLRSKAPPHSILSECFRYTPAAQTDIRKRFALVRREQAEIAKAHAAEQEARERTNVRTINRRGRTA